MEEIWERRTGTYIKGVAGKRKDHEIFQIGKRCIYFNCLSAIFYVSTVQLRYRQ